MILSFFVIYFASFIDRQIGYFFAWMIEYDVKPHNFIYKNAKNVEEKITYNSEKKLIQQVKDMTFFAGKWKLSI